MKVNQTSQNHYSFGASIVRNRELLFLMKDTKKLYGKKGLRTLAEKVKNIGGETDTFEIKLQVLMRNKTKNGTEETPVSYVLYNNKFAGYFKHADVKEFVDQKFQEDIATKMFERSFAQPSAMKKIKTQITRRTKPISLFSSCANFAKESIALLTNHVKKLFTRK